MFGAVSVLRTISRGIRVRWLRIRQAKGVRYICNDLSEWQELYISVGMSPLRYTLREDAYACEVVFVALRQLARDAKTRERVLNIFNDDDCEKFKNPRKNTCQFSKFVHNITKNNFRDDKQTRENELEACFQIRLSEDAVWG